MRRFTQSLALTAVLLIPLFATLHLAQAQEAPATPTPEPTTAVDSAAESPTAVPDTPDEPIQPQFHTISSGESLAYVANLYGTTVEALQLVNNILDPALVYIGQELAIPSATGDAVPTTYIVSYGDTLADVALRFRTTMTAVAQTNNLVAPNTIYAGQRLILISRTGSGTADTLSGTPYLVQSGDTLRQVASKTRTRISELAELNGLSTFDRIYPGERLRLPPQKTNDTFNLMPSGWLTMSLTPQTILPGETAVLRVGHTEPGQAFAYLTTPAGDEITIPLTPESDTTHVGLIGFDAFSPTGRYTLRIEGEGRSRPWRPFSQQFVVGFIDYGLQEIAISEELASLLTPELRLQENAFLQTIFTDSDPAKQWTGIFTPPVIDGQISSFYGASRTYNGAPIINFHSGIDFAGDIGTPILAPAAGTVVYQDYLELRGNVLILDHGMGVMTAYYHLSLANVAVGDEVIAGQKIAEGGDTGLSTGPHLHWDIRVWGQAIQPQRWLNQSYP